MCIDVPGDPVAPPAGISIPQHPLPEGLTRSRVVPAGPAAPLVGSGLSTDLTGRAGRAGRDVPVRAGLGVIGRA